MAKYKLVGRKSGGKGTRPNAAGCITLLVFLFLLVFWAIYLTVRQG